MSRIAAMGEVSVAVALVAKLILCGQQVLVFRCRRLTNKLPQAVNEHVIKDAIATAKPSPGHQPRPPTKSEIFTPAPSKFVYSTRKVNRNRSALHIAQPQSQGGTFSTHLSLQLFIPLCSQRGLLILSSSPDCEQ